MGNLPSCVAPDAWRTADMTHEDVVEEAETGDLILFQGGGADARFIRCTSLNPVWSHVGVVIVDPATRQKYITEAYPTVIGNDPWRQRHTGVQVTRLGYRLATYPTGKMAWRPLRLILNVSAVDDPQLGESIRWARLGHRTLRWMFERFRELYMKPQPGKMPKYNMDPIDFWEYGTRGDPPFDLNDGKYVCTSWASLVLLEMRVFEPVIKQRGESRLTVPGNILLADFGGTSPLPMRHGLDYGDPHFFTGGKYTGS